MGAGEVFDEVGGLLEGEGVEEVGGHEGLVKALAGGDVCGFDGDCGAAGEGELDLVGGFGADHAGLGGAVFELEGMEEVVVADDGVGVEDVFEEVVEVGAVGAGKAGADCCALAEELVAGAAGVVVDETAAGGVGFIEEVGGEFFAPGFDLRFEVSRGFGAGPVGRDEFVELRVVEAFELGEEDGGDEVGGEFFFVNGLEKDEGKIGSTGEVVDGVGAEVGGKVFEVGEDGVGVVGVGLGAEGGKGLGLEFGVGEEGAGEFGEFRVLGESEEFEGFLTLGRGELIVLEDTLPIGKGGGIFEVDGEGVEEGFDFEVIFGKGGASFLCFFPGLAAFKRREVGQSGENLLTLLEVLSGVSGFGKIFDEGRTAIGVT